MRKQTTQKSPNFSQIRKTCLCLVLHSAGVLSLIGCGGIESQSDPITKPFRQDVISHSPIPMHQPQSSVEGSMRSFSSHDVPRHTSTLRSDVEGTSLEGVKVDLDQAKSDSARSSLTSISSSWGAHPVEELMNEFPPCGSFPTRLSLEISNGNSNIDFKVRMVDINMVSEYGRLNQHLVRAWRNPTARCLGQPKSFHLQDCGESVDFVIDDYLIHAVHPGVREHRAIAIGRNKVSVKFFDTKMYPGIIERGAAEFAALSLLHGATSPTLFTSSIPPCFFALVQSYHGYHHLGDLRGVASIPSMDLLTRLGIQGLRMIRFMHSRGIVHGSINVRTLRYRKDHIVDSLRLVDFWISSRAYVDVDRKLIVGSNFEFQPISYMSIFQLESLVASRPVPAPSRRDDILGLAESLILLVVGGDEIFDSIDPDEILNRKRSLGFQAATYPRIYGLYKRARELDQNAVPNYDQMIEFLST